MDRDDVLAEQQSVLSEFNDRFAFCEIGQDARKPAIIELDAAGRFVCRRTLEDFKTFIKHTTAVKNIVPVFDDKDAIVWKSAAQWWLNQRHRSHSRMILAPPGSSQHLDEHAWNLWRGFSVMPMPGSWERNQEFFTDVLCNGDSALVAWLLNWLAALVQKPGMRGHTAPMLVGGQGIGKGHFAKEMVGRLFDRREFGHVSGEKELTGDFSEHLSGKIVIFADEAFCHSADAVSQIKRMITEDTIMVHPKFFPRYEEPSCLHLILASNYELPTKIDRDERRFAVIDVSDAKQQNMHYFRALCDELNSGGRAALLYDLQQYPVDFDLVRQAPSTHAKTRMKAASLQPLQLFWRDYLVSDGVWREQVPCDSLHRDMLDWFAAHGHDRPYPSLQQLGSFLSKHFHEGGMSSWPRKGRFGSTRAYAYGFPPRDTCYMVFERATRVPVEITTDQFTG